MGRVIALANQKGGVGKTTTAVNLAAALALDGYPTLLIDLDPQGSATTGVGHHPGSVDGTSYDLLLGDRPTDDLIHTTCIDLLSLIPATRDLVGADIELVNAERRE